MEVTKTTFLLQTSSPANLFFLDKAIYNATLKWNLVHDLA